LPTSNATTVVEAADSAVAAAAQPPRSTRRSKRVRPGPLRVDVGEGRSGTLIDLSELGALFELPAAQEVDSYASFDLHADQGIVTLHGRIVRCTPRYETPWRVAWEDPEPAAYHVAVEFFDIVAHAATTLREILNTAGGDPEAGSGG
jgi:hypothetical protein